MTLRVRFACQHRFESGFAFDVDFGSSSDMTILSGPSGSGKSTALAVLAGTLKPVAGTVQVGSQTFVDTESGTWLSPEHRGAGVVFQDLRLFPHLNVAANIRYGMKSCSESRDRFRDVVDAFHLSPFLQRRPQSLSGGQRQRVAIGRAIVACQRLLLLDEPVSSLEWELRDAVLNFVAEFVKEMSIPCVMATHDLEALKSLPYTLVPLDYGRKAESLDEGA